MPTKIDPKVLSWASDIEENTADQARLTASLPFIAGYVALMPDAHLGMGATIGSVIPTIGALVPAAVGVDIGCGMAAIRTETSVSDLPDLDLIHIEIASRIPAGLGKWRSPDDRRTAATQRIEQAGLGGFELDGYDNARIYDQLGTLGSGNHFIEVLSDEHDRVWIVLHSGSRGVGNAIAQRHIESAKGLMRRYFIDLPDPDLAYLVEGTPEFDHYVSDLLWAQGYALASREWMLSLASDGLGAAMGKSPGAEFEVNCHHNYAEMEHHHGRNVWVTRKGAIRARTGDMGIVPGSMGTGVAIVSGLNNPASFTSSAHGAGRKMSRTKARKSLSVEDLRQRMEGKGWNAEDAVSLLDEHPSAYKDLDQVIEDQSDLVKVEYRLRTLVNYKGT